MSAPEMLAAPAQVITTMLYANCRKPHYCMKPSSKGQTGTTSTEQQPQLYLSVGGYSAAAQGTTLADTRLQCSLQLHAVACTDTDNVYS